MYHIYHQEVLLLQLCGDYAKPLLNNLFLTKQFMQRVPRRQELRQSERVAKEVGVDDLGNRFHDFYYLHELADFFEPSDDQF